MDLPLHPRRMAGADGGLLSLMLPPHERHARSNGGNMGMPPLSIMDFQQVESHPQDNFLSGSSDFFHRGSNWRLGLPTARPETRHVWRQEQHAGQPRPDALNGKKSATCHRRHQEGRVDAACGRIKSSAWSNPHRPTIGLNTAPMEPPGKRKAKALNTTRCDGLLAGGDVGQPKTRGSMSRALEVASSVEGLMQARRALTKDFWAASTILVKQSRRAEVFKVAKAIVGNGEILPLTQSTVEGVAAALKAGGMTSANLYLQELKLAHIEAGFDLEAWLSRTFVLCGKSLSRNRGPVKRAPEVNVDRVTPKLQKPISELWVPLAGLAYAWGVAWMLREVELSKVAWKHITFFEDKKWVKLLLPLSKTDQQGLGVSRTLKCCGERSCWTGCAWALALKLKQLRDGLSADDPTAPVFPNWAGGFPSKSEMVNSWSRMFGENVKGHSARRSGAMAYTRRGMPLQDLAYLGRWKSGVVLIYAEEALESVPANQNNTVKKQRASPSVGEASKPEVVTDLMQDKSVIKPPKSDLLWVKSAERGCTALHLVDNAAWDRPMDAWSTACGWFFARKSSRFSFSTTPSFAAVKCKKCMAMKKMATLRDGVKEALIPAQSVADDMVSKLKPAVTHARPGQAVSAHGKRVEGGSQASHSRCRKSL